MTILHPVHAKDVREHWPTIRPRLVSLLERFPDIWIPEDVYLELRTGQAHLYLLESDGFCVLKKLDDYAGPVLFVWILDADPQTMKDGERYRAVLEELDALARLIGAKQIRQHSPRGGWTAKGMFKLKMHIYVREVSNG